MDNWKEGKDGKYTQNAADCAVRRGLHNRRNGVLDSEEELHIAEATGRAKAVTQKPPTPPQAAAVGQGRIRGQGRSVRLRQSGVKTIQEGLGLTQRSSKVAMKTGVGEEGARAAENCGQTGATHADGIDRMLSIERQRFGHRLDPSSGRSYKSDPPIVHDRLLRNGQALLHQRSVNYRRTAGHDVFHGQPTERCAVYRVEPSIRPKRRV